MCLEVVTGYKQIKCFTANTVFMIIKQRLLAIHYCRSKIYTSYKWQDWQKIIFIEQAMAVWRMVKIKRHINKVQNDNDGYKQIYCFCLNGLFRRFGFTLMFFDGLFLPRCLQIPRNGYYYIIKETSSAKYKNNMLKKI